MSFQTTYGPDGRLRVAILGCTGSIGTQALDVCRQHADRLQVTALSVNSSTPELVAAAREFSVSAVAVADAGVARGNEARRWRAGGLRARASRRCRLRARRYCGRRRSRGEPCGLDLE